VNSGTFCGTDDSAEVVRVFDFVKNYNKRRLVLSALSSVPQNVPEFTV